MGQDLPGFGNTYASRARAHTCVHAHARPHTHAYAHALGLLVTLSTNISILPSLSYGGMGGAGVAGGGTGGVHLDASTSHTTANPFLIPGPGLAEFVREFYTHAPGGMVFADEVLLCAWNDL